MQINRRSHYLCLKRFSLPLTCAFVFLSLRQAEAQDIILKDSFIKKYKNRVTISVNFIVDHAKDSPNTIGTGGDDGDLHIAGRSLEVGLPMVAEIVNARTEQDAVKLVDTLVATGEKVPLVGIWRLWCEHPGKNDHVQGKPVGIPKHTNPDHVFEIHPVTDIKSRDLSGSVGVIPGYIAYSAEVAFGKYEGKAFTIIHDPSKKRTTLRTKMIGWNYTRFKIEISGEDQKVVEDGRFVIADVLDASGETIASRIRMVFLKDSDAEDEVKNLGAGDRLEVLGVPRIDLEEVWSRVKKGKSNPDVLKRDLPYEMIILGVY